ncbi:MAG: nitroreductase/quinone reductase family protein [Acidimicrobiia bacterium]|nr:nitroreductase/quinone reductase family protein [Acidimicrobiia bacterium]
MWRFHKLMWKVSGGRLGSKTRGMDVLELITTGHKSGARRSVLIFYLLGDTGPLVCGSNSGATHDPSWVKNLRADPLAIMVKDRKSTQVKGQFLTGDARSQAFERFAKVYPDYSTYRELTDREIPVVVLESL